MGEWKTAQASESDISSDNYAYALVFVMIPLNFYFFPTSIEKPEEATIFLGNVFLSMGVLVFSYKRIRETFYELTLLFVNAVFFHLNLYLWRNLIKSYLC